MRRGGDGVLTKKGTEGTEEKQKSTLAEYLTTSGALGRGGGPPLQRSQKSQYGDESEKKPREDND